MSPLTTGVLSFAVCALCLPVAMRVAGYWQIYDAPGDLKIHHSPIPRIGGIAIMVGFCAATAPLWIQLPGNFRVVLLAVSAVWVTGLIDDLRGLPPLLRLAVQLGAGSILCA